MKSLKLMVAVALAMISTVASAQSDFFLYGKNNVSVGYATLSAKNSDEPLRGGRISYTRILELNEYVPVFLETGGQVQYATVSENEIFNGNRVHSEFDLGYVAIPVNVGYQFNIGESGFSIAPKAGLTLVANIIADFDVKMGDKKFGLNWFDDVDAKRFNIGWQVGGDIAYKRVVLGITYGQDFNKFIGEKNVPIGKTELNFVESKWKRFHVSIGCRF